MLRHLFTAALLLASMSAAPLALAAAEDEAAVETYRYSVTASDLGDIGEYVNRVTRRGDETIVETDMNIKVKVLLVTAFRLEADRRETWRDGRLVAYESNTVRNGERVVVNGRANGEEGFLIEGPLGTAEVPSAIHPLNPWSKTIIAATTVMAPESGRTYEIAVHEAGTEVIEIGGRSVETRVFETHDEEPLKLWFDAEGVPVQFSMMEDGRELLLALKTD